MDRELWKQVDALLEQALEQPPEAREAFVAAAAQDNPVLRDEVLSLLKAQSQAANFMERSAMKVAAHALAQDSRITTIVSTLVGQEIATYKIEKLLGAGGMGEVYPARDLKLGRMVALKVLPLHFVVDADRLSRFQREARALSSLNHPNLVTIYEVGEANGLHFIAMELVEGKTLSSLRDKVSLKELLSIVAQVAEALGAAHQSGIIHRDVKPDNVMVRPDGYAKVLDFGLVKLAEVEPTPGTAAQTQLGIAMVHWLTCRRNRRRESRWTIAPTSGVLASCCTSSRLVRSLLPASRDKPSSTESYRDNRAQSMPVFRLSWIRFSAKHSRRIESFVTKRLPISAQTFVVCCDRLIRLPADLARMWQSRSCGRGGFGPSSQVF